LKIRQKFPDPPRNPKLWQKNSGEITLMPVLALTWGVFIEIVVIVLVCILSVMKLLPIEVALLIVAVAATKL
jgi:hypothetical protein